MPRQLLNARRRLAHAEAETTSNAEHSCSRTSPRRRGSRLAGRRTLGSLSTKGVSYMHMHVLYVYYVQFRVQSLF